MDLVTIYGCFCDHTRLRLLNLLSQGPLCVCHLQEVLGASQVKVSKHLRYLRTHGMVEVRREANWRIYRLTARPTAALKANLACLQDCSREDSVFQGDLKKLRRLSTRPSSPMDPCCTAPRRPGSRSPVHLTR